MYYSSAQKEIYSITTDRKDLKKPEKEEQNKINTSIKDIIKMKAEISKIEKRMIESTQPKYCFVKKSK